MIPRIIHQIWIGPAPMPRHWMQTVRAHHAGWDYRIWTDETAAEYLSRSHIKAAKHIRAKADLLRYELLREYGGIYVDADCICFHPFNGLVDCQGFAGYESDTRRVIGNTVIGCSPRDDIMTVALAMAIERLQAAGDSAEYDWAVTGPGALTDAINQTELAWTIHEHDAFYPVAKDEVDLLHLSRFTPSAGTYTLHLWGDGTRYTEEIYSKFVSIAKPKRPVDPIDILIPMAIGHKLRSKTIASIAAQTVPCSIVPVTGPHSLNKRKEEATCRNALRDLVKMDDGVSLLLDSDIEFSTERDVEDMIAYLESRPDLDGVSIDHKGLTDMDHVSIGCCLIRNASLKKVDFTETPACCCIPANKALKLEYLPGRRVTERYGI